MDRTGIITALILVALSTALSPQTRASEAVLLRWITPPEADVAGYKIYLMAGCAYPVSRFNIGFRAADPDGIASFPLALPADGEEYEIMLTAYALGGVESAFSNAICRQKTQAGTQPCAPRTDCRRPEAPSETLLDVWYLEWMLNETANVLRLTADQGLMRNIDKLKRIIEGAGDWMNGDAAALRAALKSFAKAVKKLSLLERRGGDPTRVGMAADEGLDVLRMIAQREVSGLVCWGDHGCRRDKTRMQEKIWKGDAKRTKGRRTSAAAHYVSAFVRASKL